MEFTDGFGIRVPGTSGPPDVEGPCPYCLRQIMVWWNDPPKRPGVFVHSVPECERFKSLTADEFVASVAHGMHKQ